MENFYTAQEVADLLKLRKTTVYELVKKNELPATKVGKQIRIHKESLDEYLRGQVSGDKLSGQRSESKQQGQVAGDKLRGQGPEGKQQRQITGDRLRGQGSEGKPEEYPGAENPAPVKVADASDSAFTAREYLRSNTGMILTGEEDFLSVFCAYYQLHENSIPVVRQAMNWYDSLYSLYFGKIHAAFIPLPSGREEEICDRMMPGLRINGVHVADVSYGLFLRKGYADTVRSVADISGSGLRFMAGEKGSLERILFDVAVKKADLKKERLNLVGKESISTLQGLMCMEEGQADAVIGCETNCELFPDFDYVPLFDESLMLLYNRKYESFPAFPAMETVLSMNSFKRRLSLISGYDCTRAGRKAGWQ